MPALLARRDHKAIKVKLGCRVFAASKVYAVYRVCKVHLGQLVQRALAALKALPAQAVFKAQQALVKLALQVLLGPAAQLVS